MLGTACRFSESWTLDVNVQAERLLLSWCPNVARYHFAGATSYHDLLSPPLRPPRPNRTLGGTNLRADIVEASSSTSILREGEFTEVLSTIFLFAAADGSDVFVAPGLTF